MVYSVYFLVRPHSLYNMEMQKNKKKRQSFPLLDTHKYIISCICLDSGSKSI